MRRIVLIAVLSLATCALWLAPAGASAAAFSQCPAVDADTGCQFLITVTDSGTTVAADPTQGPYESADDALIGIQNNSSHPISSIPLSAEDELFGFESDGICGPGAAPVAPGCQVLEESAPGVKTLKAKTECGYTGEVKGGKPALTEDILESCGFPVPAGEPTGVTFPTGVTPIGYEHGDAVSGYEGPRTWYTGIASVGSFATGEGVINFSPVLAPGESTYFGLESPPANGFGTATTLSTTLTGGGQTGASISVLQGTPVTDRATLSGFGAATAGGTVTYSVYGDAGCTQLAASAGSASVAGGVGGASSALPGLAPGKYYWRASYSGEVNNQPVSSVCGSEVLTVLAPTTTSTIQTGGGVKGAKITVPVGTPVTDAATIAGLLAPGSTGTVTYGLYKDSKCTLPAAVGSAAVVTKGVAAPSAALKPAAGTYYWTAAYSGDGANAGSVSACGSEILVVAKKANLGLASVLGNGKKCVSKRRFIAHPRAPKGVKLVSVEVQINGKRVSLGKLVRGAATINLIGLPKGAFKISLIATSSKGQTFEDVRTFHTCVPKKHHRKKK